MRGGQEGHGAGSLKGAEFFRNVAKSSEIVPCFDFETLCIEEERVVARDNTVTYDSRRLQLPAGRARAHYVKARVKVREYPDGTLAVFHGPRRIAHYTAQGAEIAEVPITRSVTPCLPPSRRGLSRVELAAPMERRPSLTASTRGVTEPGQVGTKKRPSDRTKKPAGKTR
jgi:hypothetical protein